MHALIVKGKRVAFWERSNHYWRHLGAPQDAPRFFAAVVTAERTEADLLQQDKITV